VGKQNEPLYLRSLVAKEDAADENNNDDHFGFASQKRPSNDSLSLEQEVNDE
jgi:hypothetical protein